MLSVIKTLKYIALGEFIPTEKIIVLIKNMFGMEPKNQEEQEMLEEIGGNSVNILENMEGMLIFGVGLILVVAVVVTLSLCAKKNKYVNAVY